MSWFRRKPKPLPIPQYVEHPIQLESKPEPMIVEETIDPSESLVMRVKDLIKKRLKTED